MEAGQPVFSVKFLKGVKFEGAIFFFYKRENSRKNKIKTHFNGQEVEATFISQGLGYHGLGAARRPIEQDAFRGQNPHAGEGLRMTQGPLHGLLQLQLHVFHASYISPADLREKVLIYNKDRNINS